MNGCVLKLLLLFRSYTEIRRAALIRLISTLRTVCFTIYSVRISCVRIRKHARTKGKANTNECWHTIKPTHPTSQHIPFRLAKYETSINFTILSLFRFHCILCQFCCFSLSNAISIAFGDFNRTATHFFSLSFLFFVSLVVGPTTVVSYILLESKIYIHVVDRDAQCWYAWLGSFIFICLDLEALEEFFPLNVKYCLILCLRADRMMMNIYCCCVWTSHTITK